MEQKEVKRNQGQMLFGGIVILLGLVFLIDNLVDIRVWAYFWPLLLIGLGFWLIMRPKMVRADTAVTQLFIGDIDRSGDWQVTDEEFWGFIVDANLDLTKADLPVGETRLRFSGFVDEVDLFLPEDVGLSLTANGFVSSIKTNGHKEERILTPLKWQSDDYKAFERRVRLDMAGFVSEVKVRFL